MENVTHTLIGVLIGRAAARKDLPVAAAVWTAVIGNNFPDIDFLMRPIFENAQLGYLVHHRGYTHTVLAALPLGLAAGLIGGRLGKAGPEARARLIALGIGSVLLHITADFWNNYGVHPFWPFDNHWYYGDFIFIVEPLLWVSMLPFAFAVAGPRLRWLCGALVALILGLAWLMPTFPTLVAVWITAWFAAMAWLQHRVGGLKPAVVAVLAVLAAFGTGGILAREQVRTSLDTQARGEQIVEVQLSPEAGNPLCWQTIALSRTEEADPQWVARMGLVSLAPGLIAPEACPMRVAVHRTAPLSVPSIPSSPQVRWTGEFQRPMEELQRLAAEKCHAAAFLRFGRAPFWVRREDGWVIGDLRYDFEEGLGFAELELPGGSDPPGCLVPLPPWVPDAARLFLRGGQSS